MTLRFIPLGDHGRRYQCVFINLDRVIKLEWSKGSACVTYEDGKEIKEDWWLVEYDELVRLLATH